MGDLTLAIYEHTIWFFLGISVFILLSFYKLYLHYYYAEAPYTLKVGFGAFILGTEPRYFLSFLCKRNTWYPEFYEGYQKPTVILRIVDGLRVFMKPYLIIGLLWYFIELLIFTRLDYDPLHITLGRIQLLISFLNGIPLLHYLSEHKKIVFVFAGLAVIYIPVLFDYRQKLTTLKDYAGSFLIYLGIASSISLFGASTGRVTSERSDHLAKLELRVRAVHDSIFISLTKQYLQAHYEKAMNNALESSAQDIADIEEALKTRIHSNQIQEDTRNGLNDSLSSAIARLRLQYTIQPIPDLSSLRETIHQKIPAGEQNYRAFVKKNKAATSNYAGYMADPADWNLADGEALREAVNSNNGELHAESSRLQQTIDLLSEYLVGVITDKGLERIKLGDLKFLGKLIELVSNNTLISNLNETLYRYLNRLGKSGREINRSAVTRARNEMATPINALPIDYHTDLALARSGITKQLFDQQMSGLQKNISDYFDMHRPISTYVDDRFNDYYETLQAKLTGQSPGTLAGIYKLLRMDQKFPAMLQTLQQHGYISKQELETGNDLSYHAILKDFIVSGVGSDDNEPLIRRFHKMNDATVRALANLTENADFIEFLDRSKAAGLLSEDEYTTERENYYRNIIRNKIDEFSREENEFNQRRYQLQDLLTNHHLTDLMNIMQLSENTENLFQWMKAMEKNRYMTSDQVVTYHEICKCVKR